MSGLLAARRSPLPGGCIHMDGASTPGTRARESLASAPGMGKGGPGCVRRWPVLMLAPAQLKSLPQPVYSPWRSAASPFPPQHVWLLLALISCALSPLPPPLSPAHSRALHSQAPHTLVPADALCSPLQLLAETCVPPWSACPTVPLMHVQAEGWDGDVWARLGQQGHKD